MNPPGEIFLPKGFKFSAVTAGIKASGKPDLALIVADPGTSAAALFTKNRIVAAPLEVGRAALSKSRGEIRAVIVNSGNANCATGDTGISNCQKVCSAVARLLGVEIQHVFPSSTGIIGVPLPTEKITSQLPVLLQTAAASGERLLEFADAILTTDTRPKLASVRLQSGIAVTGIAKGAGMIHPQLATMLVYVLTDAGGTSAELRKCLRRAGNESFNLISVDGDTSTNDTVLLLASGQAKIKLRKRSEFEDALHEVCRSLAEQIVADGEGVQHVIRLNVLQAKSRDEALQVARTIAHSLLVKTAWAGADPNWGRILAAIGRCGVAVDPKRINLTIGDQTVCRGSVACAFDQARAHEELSKPECSIAVHLGRGTESLEFLTTDLSSEYVTINADYST
jgi:glutamate N-acetyltransferase/amino-acid N-acetyltransferase